MYPFSDMDMVAIALFGSGLSNKMYQISHPHWTTKYLFRVSLPVDPVNKTESEIATLVYVRRYTTIPVPKPIAWDSSSDNKLGFEWSILEKTEGVEVAAVWGVMPWKAKVKLAHDLAGICAQLWAMRFEGIGSLCFGGVDIVKSEHSDDGSAEVGEKEGKGPRFVKDIPVDTIKVGKMVAPVFIVGRRIHVPSNRGPFNSSHDWVRSLIEVEKNVIISNEEIVRTCPMSPEGFDLISLDENFQATATEMKRLCDYYLHSLPLFFLPDTAKPDLEAECEPEPDFMLSHEDLHSSNILIDPITFKITGIIDWEMSRVIPGWSARKHPKIFKDEMDINPPAPPPGNLEDGSEHPDRGRWEAFLLRRCFEMGLRRFGMSVTLDNSEQLKDDFCYGVHQLSAEWVVAKGYLKQLMGFVEGRRQSE